jgi:Virulence-associated protein E
MSDVDPRLIAAIEPLTRRVRTDVTAKKDANGVMSWTREPLTEKLLAKHMNGGPARGTCPIKAGESVTMVGLLDFDSHKGESTWAEMVAAAQMVAAELESRFMSGIAFRSSGGKGIHLYVIWDGPQDAYSVRMELVEAIAACGFTNGTAGVNRKQIEVFPKQNSVPESGYGNQFILPLAGLSEPLEQITLKPAGKEAAIGMDWPVSVPVPVRVAPTRSVAVPAQMRTEDLGLLERALFAIPNTDDSGDRDWWFPVMCAFKEGGGDIETARSWTMQHGSYADEKFDGPWDSITVGKEGGTPVEYLYRLAEKHGFREHIVDEFPDYTEQDAAARLAAHVAPPLPAWPRDRLGRIESSITNVTQAIRHAYAVGFQVAYDTFRDELIVSPPGTTGQWRAMVDADQVQMRLAMEDVGFKSPSKEIVRDACTKIGSENTVDTAQMWLLALKWDGKRRIGEFLRMFMGCDNTPYAVAVSHYIWSALAGRILEPGVKADMVPIFEGAQGIRKSSAIEAMAPAPEFFVEIDMGEKEEDTVRKLRGALVGEVAELSGLRNRDLEAIKKFVVRRVEKWIPKYKEFTNTFARRLLFIGTTNKTDVLADETGNRRWLPINCTKADVEGIIANRDQLWAEGATMFQEHGVMWAEAEALGVHEHAAYTIEDSWDSSVLAWLNATDDFDEGGVKNGSTHFTTSRVLSGALQIAAKDQDRLASNRVGAILRGLGYEHSTKRANGSVGRTWRKKECNTCNTL